MGDNYYNVISKRSASEIFLYICESEDEGGLGWMTSLAF